VLAGGVLVLRSGLAVGAVVSECRLNHYSNVIQIHVYRYLIYEGFPGS